MRTSVKRILICILILSFALSLSSCSKYRVEMSNSRQSEAMLTVGGETVAFEVVDFFYHARLDAYPDEPFEDRMTWVEASICELYAIFAVAAERNIDPYGDTVEAMLEDYVKEMIDSYPTRRDYIDDITAIHMTDATCRLLLRASICEGVLSSLTDIDEQTLRTFAAQDDVLRVLTMQLSFDTQRTWAEGRMGEILEKLGDGEDFLTVARELATSESEHTYITVRQWYRLCGDAALAPAVGVMSDPLWESDTVLLMKVVEKDLDFIAEHPANILDSYLEYLIEGKTDSLQEGLEKTDAYSALTEENFVDG
ncbi:MAG: hypothetical protein IJ009_01565 [Clostridia bacterium]|nr:hypothetical protein [Clostridia bacterium]